MYASVEYISTLISSVSTTKNFLFVLCLESSVILYVYFSLIRRFGNPCKLNSFQSVTVCFFACHMKPVELISMKHYTAII